MWITETLNATWCGTECKYLLFPVALLPNAGHGLLICEVSRSHTTTHHSRWDSSGRVISSSQIPPPDNTQHLKRQTSMPLMGFETTTQANERPASYTTWPLGLAMYIYKIVKVKWSRYRPGVAQRVGRGIALLFHDRGTRRGWVVSSTPRPHFTSGKDAVPIVQEARWVPGRCARAENLVPTGIRSRTVQPVVSRYTNWATRPTKYIYTLWICVIQGWNLKRNLRTCSMLL